MKFIHTSDWHIGRQFHNVSLLDDQRQVLAQLIGYVETEGVDALVVAGDIYDRAVPPAAAVDLLDEVLNRVCAELGVPVILIPGNHDSAERLRFGARQLRRAGLHILGDLERITEPVVLGSGGAEVHFYGIPYADPETVRHHFGVEVSGHDAAHGFLVDRIKAARSDRAANVLVSHCFVDGGEESESERPLSIGGADRVSFQPMADFDYVALGHLHSPQYRGADHIRYCGSLLKYSFSEQHQKKGVTLVEMSAGGLTSARHLPLVPPRDMRVLEGDLRDLLDRGRTDPGNRDYLLVRLTDRHALLDPMGRLRQVYPNVLHLEKPGMLETDRQLAGRERLRRGELDMFRDFFHQVAGRELNEEQDRAIQQCLEDIHRSKQGG